MGFNKRYITKQAILNCTSQDSVLKLLRADALICDAWATKFLKEFNHQVDDYQTARQILSEKTGIYSGGEFKTYPEYQMLKSLGNVYFNLKTSREQLEWIDISLALDLTNAPVPQEIAGYVEKLQDYCIKVIEKHFD